MFRKYAKPRNAIGFPNVAVRLHAMDKIEENSTNYGSINEPWNWLDMYVQILAIPIRKVMIND